MRESGDRVFSIHAIKKDNDLRVIQSTLNISTTLNTSTDTPYRCEKTPMIKSPSRVITLIGLGLVVLLLAVFFPPLQSIWLEAYEGLNATWQFVIELSQILLITILFAAFLAPLEALGWWAGWYGDQIDTVRQPGILAEPFPTDRNIIRYVVYLDGIAQAQYDLLPEVERFLDELAADLPDENVLIKGIMPYSVLNRPLTERRILSFFWRLADRFQMTASGGILGALIGATINIRNVLVVMVSADQRYGPIYNRGTAQVICNSLLHYGYDPGSGIPITLLGYSGGGQMAVGAAPYLRRALKAPIDVISLSGVISGNQNLLELEHLYYLVGDKDIFEKEGPIFFPRRWKLFFLSYWNRAKQRGKISFISLGPVGHNGILGPYSSEARLPDGRTHLQQTVELISSIIQGTSPIVQAAFEGRPGNYDRYWQASFNQPSYYPLHQTTNPELYRPIALWMGRLILPTCEQRRSVNGVLFEVHHADPDYEHLVGQVVCLSWSNDPRTKDYLRRVTKDVHFSEEAKYSHRQGFVHPCRLNHWKRVDPLESLAGSRPQDDVIVALNNPVVVERIGVGSSEPISYTLAIAHDPIQITGRFYALVKVLEPVQAWEVNRSPQQENVYAALPQFALTNDFFRVVHFNPVSHQFDGFEEIVRIPYVIADMNGCFPSSNQDMNASPLNETGWYVYGAADPNGFFVVQSIAPRALLRLQPDAVVVGEQACWHYLKRDAWIVEGQKGKTSSVLLIPNEKLLTIDEPEPLPSSSNSTPPTAPVFPMQSAINQWQEGDQGLVVHVYGGIGGKKREPAARTPVFFGHFAYGVAQVIREPLTQELMFDINYHQVYTHNVDGIIAGTLAWNRFLGDRQFGWLGTRPVCDLIIKLDAFTKRYDLNGVKRSALDNLAEQLEAMTARYRIGDGTGGTYVGFAHNCAQDSNQALYTTIKRIRDAVDSSSAIQTMLANDPLQASRFEQLMTLGKYVKRELLPFGTARADWKTTEDTLGISPEEEFFQGILTGLISWRTLLPRLASETIAKQFLDQGAVIWVLRTNQVGGYDPDIEPIAPTPFC